MVVRVKAGTRLFLLIEEQLALLAETRLQVLVGCVAHSKHSVGWQVRACLFVSLRARGVATVAPATWAPIVLVCVCLNVALQWFQV